MLARVCPMAIVVEVALLLVAAVASSLRQRRVQGHLVERHREPLLGTQEEDLALALRLKLALQEKETSSASRKKAADAALAVEKKASEVTPIQSRFQQSPPLTSTPHSRPRSCSSNMRTGRASSKSSTRSSSSRCGVVMGQG